jgi:glucose-6-phosphate 1-dehydrogenase
MGATEVLEPTAIVIFGAAGDLTWRKLVPALYDLYRDGGLPEPFALLGVDREEITERALRLRFRDGVRRFARHRVTARRGDWDDFAACVHYLRGDLTDPDAYARIGARLARFDKGWGVPANHIFYLAVAPFLVEPVTDGVAAAGLCSDPRRTRIVVEKPIGHDLASALRLNTVLSAKFAESQIFRIDHYLGKETVQNILAFRFANPLFEPIWDRRYVDHVTITVAEDIGVGHRGSYYERAGALRDMVQNHLFQILCLVAMEPPVTYDADEIRNKKVDVLHAVRPIRPEEVALHAARGQYADGWVRGEQVRSYREEEEVSPASNTETFAALKLFVDNWRWQDVPFYLRTGKRLADQLSEVSIRFREVPHQSFPAEAMLDWQPARLVMCIQPHEGIVLKFQAKQPGPRMRLRPVDMRFSYEEAFGDPSPDAYETLLWDVITNDATLFMRADQVEAAWRLVMPVLDAWAASPPTDFPNYMAGTWGPESAETLIARDGRNWLLPTLLNGPEEM